MLKSNNIYPPDWKQISHRVRFGRAAGCCEVCGTEHGAVHPVGGKRVWLTTAHLDRDTTHNEDDNFKAMCQYCHLNYDRRDNIRRRRINAIRRSGIIPLFSFVEP